MKKILKAISVIIIAVMLLITVQTTVNATQYAYSIGCQYPSDAPAHAGDNFNTNIKNAANIYAQISGVKSYYNNEPTYSYLTGNNPNGKRRIASYICFVNGHANAGMMLFAAHNSSAYRTGIYIGNDNTIASEAGAQYTLAGLSNTNMSTTRMIVFAGCDTGAWPNTSDNPYSTNLPSKAVDRGATSAVGFRRTITTRIGDGPNWLNKFNTCIKNGYGIDGAITAACVAYPNWDMSNCAMASGDIYATIVPVKTVATFAESDLKNQYYTIDSAGLENIYADTNMVNEDLSKHINEFSDIIQKIKEKDSTFDVSDYKVTYNEINAEQGFAHIFFTKYIDGKIETNKVYLTVIKNGKIEDIILAGIPKANLKATSTDINNLTSKIKQFENNKINKITSASTNLKNITLQNDGKINQNSISESTESVEEKYYYDYNTNELKYIIKYVEKCELNTRTSTISEVII